MLCCVLPCSDMLWYVLLCLVRLRYLCCVLFAPPTRFRNGRCAQRSTAAHAVPHMRCMLAESALNEHLCRNSHLVLEEVVHAHLSRAIVWVAPKAEHEDCAEARGKKHIDGGVGWSCACKCPVWARFPARASTTTQTCQLSQKRVLRRRLRVSFVGSDEFRPRASSGVVVAPMRPPGLRGLGCMAGGAPGDACRRSSRERCPAPQGGTFVDGFGPAELGLRRQPALLMRSQM